MNKVKIFNLVREEFNEELAIAVIVFNTIHLAMKVKDMDLNLKGNFERRLKKKFESALWQNPELVVDAQKIGLALYDYELSQTMQGLGGGKPRTLKQIVEGVDDQGCAFTKELEK